MIEFPYLIRRHYKYPIVPLVIEHGQFSLRTEALVDSGATVSVFKDSIADYLGIRIDNGERISLQGIGGRIIGYVHEVRIIIGDISFRASVVFSEEFTVSMNILGRKNFFQQFIVSFDEHRQKVILNHEHSGN